MARVTGGIQQTGVSYGDSTANVQLDGLVELLQDLRDYEAVHLKKELIKEAGNVAVPLIQDIARAYPTNPLSGWGGRRTGTATTGEKTQQWRKGGRLEWDNAKMVAGLGKRVGLRRIKGGKLGNIGVGVNVQSSFLTIIQRNAAASVFEFAGGVTPNSNLAKGIRTKFGSLPRKPLWRTIDANLNKIESAIKTAVSKTEENFNKLKASNKKGLG